MDSPAALPAEPSGTLDFPRAVERFLYDARGLGRLTTDRSVAEYRRTVLKHAAVAASSDPAPRIVRT